ncbi:MAG: acetylglutamate kinase [Alphaproteobacteria bacterium]
MHNTKINPKNLIDKASILSKALPFMQRYSEKSITIKYGGAVMGEKKLSSSFAKDIVLLKQVGINPLVIHGGGPKIKGMLDKLKVKTNFIDGLRVTDKETMKIVEMVLSGSINKEIVMEINREGGKAIGLSGKDGLLVETQKIKSSNLSSKQKKINLGFVGQPKKINDNLLNWLIKSHFIPIISPIGFNENYDTYNINADTMSGSIASSILSERLILLTDVEGVLDKKGNLLREVSIKDVKKLIKNGTIMGGMIPKVQTCIDAVNNGVKAAVILNGKLPHAILLEIFTESGVGTLITK